MKKNGFTLLEVLTAIAILAIALTAVVLASINALGSSRYLRDKTVANWVAVNVANQAQLGLIAVPLLPQSISDTQTQLNQTWYWQAQMEKTYDQYTNKITIQVGGERNKPITTIITFVRNYPT